MKKIFVKIMDKLLLDCNQATFLVSKKLDGKLSFIEKIRLKLHLMNCKFCYTFNVQSEKIDEILKITPDNLQKKCRHTVHLSDKVKKNILKEMNQSADN